jgi:hypothetical protein
MHGSRNREFAFSPKIHVSFPSYPFLIRKHIRGMFLSAYTLRHLRRLAGEAELFPGKIPDASAVSNWNQRHYHLHGSGLRSAAAMINYRDI